MPSSINVQGQRVYTPGIFATIDASALGGTGLSTGNVALAGLLPTLEKDEPRTFNSARQIQDFDPSDADLHLAAKLLFAPARDDRVPGGADSLTLINTQPVTQALATYKDVDDADSLVLQAKLWGPKGNRVFASITTNPVTGGPGIDVIISGHGISETYTDIDGGPVGEFSYDGSELDVVNLTVSPAQVLIAWEDVMGPFPGGAPNEVQTAVTNEHLSDGVEISYQASIAAAADITCTVEGLDETGTPLAGAARITTIPSGSVAVIQSTSKYSRIDDIKIETADAAFVGNVTVRGVAWDLDTSEYADVGEILGLVDQQAGNGYHAEAQSPRVGSIPADELDKLATTDIAATDATVRADLYAIVSALSVSRVVTPSRATDADLPPKQASLNASGSGASLTGAALPIDLEPGDELVLDVDEIGNATATFDAAAGYVDSAAEPYALANGNTLLVTIDGGGQQTVTFLVADFVAIGAATAAEVAAVLSRDLFACQAFDNAGAVRLRSDKRGTGSTVSIDGGTGAAALAFGAPVAGTGDVADINAVTLAEATAVIEADIPGTVVTQSTSSQLVITTVATGAAVSLEADATSADAFGVVEGVKAWGTDTIPAVQGLLAGGTKTVPVALTDWESALVELEAEDIQIVVPKTDDINIHKATITHCVNSARRGSERNAWAGATAGQTLQQLYDTWTSKLNSRFISICGQQVEVALPTGALGIKDPEYLAMVLAGMQAGTPTGTPLTFKRPDVVRTIQTWNPGIDGDDAISKGIVHLITDNLGIKVARSVTTHLSDDNPIYSEVSAFESIQTSVRDLRANLLSRIGDPAFATTPGIVKGQSIAVLENQVRDGIIKAFRNVTLEDLGDRFRINYEAAAIEPLNFVDITVAVVRIAAAA